MSFSGQIIHHWSPPATQLSPVAPRSCLHVPAATHWAMALTGLLNQVRGTDRFQTLREQGQAYSSMWRLSLLNGQKRSLALNSHEGGKAKYCLNCWELGQAPKTPRSSTAPRPASNHLNPVLQLVQGRPWWESEAGEGWPSFTLIQVSYKSWLLLSLIFILQWWVSGIVAGVDTVAAIVTNLHVGRLGHNIAFHWSKQHFLEFDNPLSVLKGLFMECTAHLHGMKGLEKVP